MSKPFKQIYKAPFNGIDVSAPPPDIEVGSAVDIINFMIHNGELISFPAFASQGMLPSGSAIRAINSFKDINGYFKTVAVTKEAMWKLMTDGTWSKITDLTATADVDHPYANNAFLGNFYLSKGVPGDTTLVVWYPYSGVVESATTLASGRFLMNLADHLLMAYTFEPPDLNGQTVFPYRIRWSANGLPKIWDPAINVGAGFNDLIEVCDEIVGLVPLGRTGYLFRSNGISEIYPISQGTTPFAFNHLWSAQRGMGGAFYPWAIASYGSFTIFASTEDFYILTSQSIEAIGGRALSKIYEDLDAGIGKTVVAHIAPRFNSSYVHLCYQVFIPHGDGTSVMWQYSLREKNWVRRTLDYQVTAPGLMVCTQ